MKDSVFKTPEKNKLSFESDFVSQAIKKSAPEKKLGQKEQGLGSKLVGWEIEVKNKGALLPYYKKNDYQVTVFCTKSTEQEDIYGNSFDKKNIIVQYPKAKLAEGIRGVIQNVKESSKKAHEEYGADLDNSAKKNENNKQVMVIDNSLDCNNKYYQGYQQKLADQKTLYAKRFKDICIEYKKTQDKNIPCYILMACTELSAIVNQRLQDKLEINHNIILYDTAKIYADITVKSAIDICCNSSKSYSYIGLRNGISDSQKIVSTINPQHSKGV